MKKFFCFLKYHIDFFYWFISKLIHWSSCINEIPDRECLGATTAVEFSRGVRLLLCFLMNCSPWIVNREHFPGCMNEGELNENPQLFAAMIATCTSLCAIWSPLGQSSAWLLYVVYPCVTVSPASCRAGATWALWTWGYSTMLMVAFLLSQTLRELHGFKSRHIHYLHYFSLI